MEQVYVKEAYSEVLILIDRNMGDRLHALEEAVRILQREVIREQSNPNRNTGRQPNSY